MISRLTSEEIEELSMIELALMILEEEKQAIDFYELFNKVCDLKGLSQEEREERIARFYTDMNVDGRFFCIGDNRWGLRNWYPYDQVDEEFAIPARTKKKKGKKKLVDDDFDDYDEDYVEDDDYLEDDEDFDDDDLLDDEDDYEDEDDFDLDEDFDDSELDDFDLDEDFDDSELDDVDVDVDVDDEDEESDDEEDEE
ncbi:DNA-directed RNA polymerase subunit delta [Calidifontibacillus erzurumensis]|uniref:Probable DNA-directed RNA polymerase subunit delta n=1 Tax=Calidifontibacillus erzurumensis TaxID=2741433 RepID=A0A8J8GGS1_9BACI|nr:DNA-directed RNA polymerase subunit delta [Calidifontibacillus erzurumensis]NSL52113.1 DNA-directed RNA polymerase subunit delta [Calidifontibacillus erzurumensis]